MVRMGDERIPRASRAQLSAVRRTAEEAGRELDRQQAVSVINLAEALGEITQDEAVGHLEARLSFLERRVERLTARREESDRGFEGEQAVMRARLEDVLEAVGATAEEQREALLLMEKQLRSTVSEAEAALSRDAAGLRNELASATEAASDRLEWAEARLSGETGSLEDRLRELAGSLAQVREEEERGAAERSERNRAVEGVSEGLVALAADVEARIEEGSLHLDLSLAALESQVKAAGTALEEELATIRGEIGARVESIEGGVEQRLAEVRAEQAAGAEEMQSGFDSARARLVDDLSKRAVALERRISEAGEASLDASREVRERMESLAGALEARASERERWLEGQLEARTAGMEERLTGRMLEAGEGLEALRRDLLLRLESAEAAAAANARHLEARLDETHRNLTSDESEWGEALREVTGDLSTIRTRLEALTGRVASGDARRATERGSTQVAVEGLTARLEILEKRVRESVDEVSARHLSRLEALASQVEDVRRGGVAAEERSGELAHLSRRITDLAERVGSLAARPSAAPHPDAGAADNAGRLAALERLIVGILARISSRQAQLSARVERLEQGTSLGEVPPRGAS